MAAGEATSQQKLVVIGIDGSEQAEHAFAFYIDNVHSKDNHLLLIHAAEPPAVSSHQAMIMNGDLWASMMAAEKERVRQLEEKFADKMRKNNVSGKIKAVFSHKPGEVVCETANEEKATMIVMGTRGLGTVRRTIMGSVSDYVVHHAHCPVMICRS